MFADQIPSVFQESIWSSEGAIFSGYGERQMEPNFQHILSCCDVPVIAASEEAQHSYQARMIIKTDINFEN